jgi:hypothetical protein
MVSLILYPSSVFLNRGMFEYFRYDNHLSCLPMLSNNFIVGNHEDIMVTVRYGFQNEVNRKYGVDRSNTYLLNLTVKLISIIETSITIARSLQGYIQLVTFVFLC